MQCRSKWATAGGLSGPSAVERLPLAVRDTVARPRAQAHDAAGSPLCRRPARFGPE